MKTVLVGCRSLLGLAIHLNASPDTHVELNGANKAVDGKDYGVTEVDQKFMYRWVEENETHPWLENGLIFDVSDLSESVEEDYPVSDDLPPFDLTTVIVEPAVPEVVPPVEASDAPAAVVDTSVNTADASASLENVEASDNVPQSKPASSKRK